MNGTLIASNLLSISSILVFLSSKAFNPSGLKSGEDHSSVRFQSSSAFSRRDFHVCLITELLEVVSSISVSVISDVSLFVTEIKFISSGKILYSIENTVMTYVVGFRPFHSMIGTTPKQSEVSSWKSTLSDLTYTISNPPPRITSPGRPGMAGS